MAKLDFVAAAKRAEQGAAVRRPEWSAAVRGLVAAGEASKGQRRVLKAWLGSGEYVDWVPGLADILADDWEIYAEPKGET